MCIKRFRLYTTPCLDFCEHPMKIDENGISDYLQVRAKI